jgi:hypothetical protein
MPATARAAFKDGFFGSLGSFGAMASFGMLVLLGVWLVYLGKGDPAQGRDKNTFLFSVGVALIVLGSLPLLPLLGITFLASAFE